MRRLAPVTTTTRPASGGEAVTRPSCPPRRRRSRGFSSAPRRGVRVAQDRAHATREGDLAVDQLDARVGRRERPHQHGVGARLHGLRDAQGPDLVGARADHQRVRPGPQDLGRRRVVVQQERLHLAAAQGVHDAREPLDGPPGTAAAVRALARAGAADLLLELGDDRGAPLLAHHLQRLLDARLEGLLVRPVAPAAGDVDEVLEDGVAGLRLQRGDGLRLPREQDDLGPLLADQPVEVLGDGLRVVVPAVLHGVLVAQVGPPPAADLVDEVVVALHRVRVLDPQRLRGRARRGDVGPGAVQDHEDVADVVGQRAHQRHEVRDGPRDGLLAQRRHGQQDVQLQPVRAGDDRPPDPAGGAHGLAREPVDGRDGRGRRPLGLQAPAGVLPPHGDLVRPVLGVARDVDVDAHVRARVGGDLLQPGQLHGVPPRDVSGRSAPTTPSRSAHAGSARTGGPPPAAVASPAQRPLRRRRTPGAHVDSRDLLLEAYGRLPDRVHAVTDGIDDATLAHRPGGDGNSVAWLVWHLTRVQDDHVSEVAGHEQAWTAGGWADRFGLDLPAGDTGYGHTPEQVGKVRASAELLAGYYDAVHAQTLDHLRTLDDAALDRVVDDSWDPPVTLGARLVSVLDDDLEHAGQAAYVLGTLGDG
ncbi:DinB family protein [Kineosporiaceae bacterium B12]|nr:DinB family protein [Kineococcus rubinsiae]